MNRAALYFTSPGLVAVVSAGRLMAQAFTNLHDFAASDGASPYGALILSGHTLYGTTKAGGDSGNGTVFRMDIDGSAFTNLHSFSARSGPLGTNADGASLYAGLVLSSNTLYGTAPYGGAAGNGTIFKLNTDGSGFAVLHSFTDTSGGNNSDGASPFGGLCVSGSLLFGTAAAGGSASWGTVFGLNTDGTRFTNLHSFTNSGGDGAYPYAGLVLLGNALYGTTLYGGSAGYGSVFKVNVEGTGYTDLYSFSGGMDGANPSAVLTVLGNALFGTAQFGGNFGLGAVFKLTTDGTGFTNLHSFAGAPGEAYSFAGLAVYGNALYGTAYQGGSANKGTLFKLGIGGTGFTNLYSFSGSADGANPYAGLVQGGNTLYGAASAGGVYGDGTIFALSFPPPPQLTIISSGANVVLMWPGDAAGFNLQSTTNLAAPAVWTAVDPPPTLVNGQNAVTNPVSNLQQFFRLMQ